MWDALAGGSGDLPRYLQLLALVSFHTFIKEGVEAAIVETHHGGEYDATNVIEHPIVSVITTLGVDHVQQLGPTIDNIAWHKAGIFKTGSAALSSVQEASATDVLRSRSSEKGVNLEFVELDSTLPEDAPQLKPEVQRINCSVALAAADRFLQEKKAGPLSSSDKVQGISQFSWPGRFQHVVEDRFDWFLDSAHNEMSVVKAAKWFIGSTQTQRFCVLVADARLTLIPRQNRPCAYLDLWSSLEPEGWSSSDQALGQRPLWHPDSPCHLHSVRSKGEVRHRTHSR